MEEQPSPEGEDVGTSTPETGMPEEAAASMKETRKQETEPKYNVTIKGAKRLDAPDLSTE